VVVVVVVVEKGKATTPLGSFLHSHHIHHIIT
jgi:hypothetical protein